MKYQRWTIKIDKKKHVIERNGKNMSSKQRIVIDGDEFELPRKPFSRLRGRRELFKLGEKQAVLQFLKTGYCEIILDGEVVKEGKRK